MSDRDRFDDYAQAWVCFTCEQHMTHNSDGKWWCGCCSRYVVCSNTIPQQSISGERVTRPSLIENWDMEIECVGVGPHARYARWVRFGQPSHRWQIQFRMYQCPVIQIQWRRDDES